MTFKKGEQANGMKGRKEKPSLTNKQRLFLAEYKKDCNGTRAAAAAGYKDPKISSCNLLDESRFPLVVAEVRRMEEAKSRESGIDAAWIVQKLTHLAIASNSDYYNPDGSCKALDELSPEAAYAVKRIETVSRTVKDKKTGEVIVKTRIVGYELESRPEALKQLAQHLGKLIDHVTNHNTVNVLDWGSLLKAVGPKPLTDPIEARIIEASKPNELTNNGKDANDEG